MQPGSPSSKAVSMPVMISPGVVSPSNGSARRTPYASYDPAASQSVAVSLAVKRWRLVGLALVAIGAVALSMLLFRGGVKIGSVELPIDALDNAKTQEKLLDQYNSYTGNAASALTKPIEVFTTMALQLVLLRFAARAVLQPENAWRVDKVAMVAAWAVLYLLLNGFNSLNVQLRPDHVVAVIRPSDLSVAVNTSSNATAIPLVTNASLVVPEKTPGNLVTNTVLRTAVVSREWLNKDKTCDDLKGGSRILEKQVTDDGVEFGFPIRSWLGKMVPSAPPTNTLTIPLTGTNATIDPAKLPMNSSRAAMLFLAAVYQSHDLLRWFNEANFNVTEAHIEAHNNSGEDGERDRARLAGVLPTRSTGSETKEREWLLREAPRLLLQKFAETKAKDIASSLPVSNDTEKGMSVAFSHVDLTPRIEFDAITFDAEVNLDKYASVTSADGKTRYHKWMYMSETCGPPPLSVCTVSKELYASDGSSFDYPSQVRAGAICVTETGSESLESLFSGIGNKITDPATVGCDGTSNTSMLVVSIAKRIVADAVIENTTNIPKLENFSFPVLVNARKIYSITVGRLGWETEDLAEVFGAKCEATSPTKCLGLQFPLTSSSESASNVNEVLVAGVDALPAEKLRRIDYDTSSEYTPLVILSEPQRGRTELAAYDRVVGDLLLPHHLANRTRDHSKRPADMVNLDKCDSWVGTRVNKVLTNHLYMEDGLQPAYTSALFWLFQDGAVRTVVKTSTDSAATTLEFDGNVQVSSLVASIPATNMWLSLAGCLLLVAAVVATVTYRGDFVDERAEQVSEQADEDARGQSATTVSDPRVIAKVMLDETRFPPMFLDRKIVDRSGRSVGITKMESFQIAAMTLEGDNGNGAKQVCTAKNTVTNEV